MTLTHDPRIDDMALMEALNLDAFYVGALGSERTNREHQRQRQTRKRGESLHYLPPIAGSEPTHG